MEWPSQPDVISVKAPNAALMYGLGLAVMMANKLRRLIRTYSTPRPFGFRDIKRNIRYALNVVREWEQVAGLYSAAHFRLADATVLEIGPGPDLGTGIILLASGAKRYLAIDFIPLAYQAPPAFYHHLLQALAGYPYVKEALGAYEAFARQGVADRLAYQVVTYPALPELRRQPFDLVVSRAVWEHVGKPEDTLAFLAQKVNREALFINEVDLATHTRYLRDLDPLNLLRYPEGTYQALSFAGSPNRLRCSDYLKIAKDVGLQEVQAVPKKTLTQEYVEQVRPALAPGFRNRELSDLAVLTFWWLGRFPGT